MNEVAIIKKDEIELLEEGNIVRIRARLLDAEEKLKNTDEYKEVVGLKMELINFEKNKTNLTNYIIENMRENKIKEIEQFGYKFKISNRKSTSCKIIDKDKVPEKYLEIKTEVKKAEALKELRKGIYIEGLELEENISEDKLEVEKII